MTHQRLRCADTALYGPGVVGKTAELVRAGRLVFLRGQSGLAPDGGFTGLGDVAAQADQAMRNVKALLDEAGAGMAQICKITTYVTDRAWLIPADQAIARHLGATAPVRNRLIVNGLALPEMLVAIDIDAVIPEGAA